VPTVLNLLFTVSQWYLPAPVFIGYGAAPLFSTGFTDKRERSWRTEHDNPPVNRKKTEYFHVFD
jgi:hypothetical protein